MKILITAPYHEKAKEELKKLFGEVDYQPWKLHGRVYNETELIELLSSSKANAIITEHDEVTEKVINSFPELKFIAVCRGTPSNVAIEAAKIHNIPVFHTPGRNAQAVAEMFLAGVIILMRKIVPATKWLYNKKWEKGAHTSYLQFKGNELANKTVGMIGFGDIGKKIANILVSVPCKIQFYDPYVKNSDPRFKSVSLEEIFETSDIVSIHLPENEETEGMINASLLSKMKKDALLVNTARASVVNREDLLEVLENNKIGGALLDVFHHEPPDEIDYKIIHLPNVFATPHIAGATYEVEDHHSFIMNEKLVKFHTEEIISKANYSKIQR
jgi:D-3-phosphoglycerate dehydrogenase